MRTAGDLNCYACFVNDCGNVYNNCYVDNPEVGIRPALILNNLQSLNFEFRTGDKFSFGEYIFTILSNNLAICDNIVGEGRFREDCEEDDCEEDDWEEDANVYKDDANVYEKSDIKKVVDDWFNNTYLDKKIGLKSSKEIFSDDDWGF